MSAGEPSTGLAGLAGNPRLSGLDALRGIAATTIVVFHLLEIHKLALPPGIRSGIGNYFGLGVPLFYTISAFSLYLGYMRRVGSPHFVGTFLVRRFFRIAPLFYLMILVWMATLKIKYNVVPPLKDIILDMAFLFNTIPGKHESIVWAGWSIGVEFLYYFAFPAIVACVRRVRSAVLLLLVSIVYANVFSHYAQGLAAQYPSYAYMSLANHLPFFAMGGLAYVLFAKLPDTPRRRTLAVALLAASLLAGYALLALHVYKLMDFLGIAPLHHFLSFYMWGGVFGLLIASQCVSPSAAVTNPVTTFLGKNSFSVYLLHPLIILLLKPAYEHIYALLPGADTLAFLCCLGITLAVLVPLSELGFRFVEQPGMDMGRRLASRLRAPAV